MTSTVTTPAADRSARAGAGDPVIRLVVPLLVVTACGGAQRAPEPARALLLVRAPVADATLWIDGAHIGTLADVGRGVRLRPGRHRVELRHDLHHTRYALVTLTAGERRTLELTLAEALP